jgi:hypothetical protein
MGTWLFPRHPDNGRPINNIMLRLPEGGVARDAQAPPGLLAEIERTYGKFTDEYPDGGLRSAEIEWPASHRSDVYATSWSREGQAMKNGEAIEYEIRALPGGRRAVVANTGHRWQIRNHDSSDWRGAFKTAEEAIRAVEAEPPN